MPVTFMTSLCPVRLARHGGDVWGETWCPGFVSLFITAWAEIVSEKGTDGTLVVAENAFLYLQCVSFVSFGVGPDTK